MTVRPLPRVLLALLVGLVPALRVPVLTHFGLLAATCVTAIYLLFPRARAGAVVAGFVVVGWMLGQAAAARSHADCRGRIPDGARVEVRGAFAAAPATDGAAPLQLRDIGPGARAVSCTGPVRARLRDDRAVAAGESLVGWGRWFAAPPEGRWPRRPERAGILVLDSVRVAGGDDGARRPLLAARGRAQERIRSLLPERSGLAEAMLLAQREGIDPGQRDRFANAGLAHLLAISGLHVGLIAGALLLLGRIVRAPPRVTAAGTVVLTAAYVLFLGAPHAAARAALQVVLVLGARLWQRPADPFSLLAAAALVLLALDPLAILEPGFQLSFAGTAGLVALRRRLLALWPTARGRAIRDSVVTSLAATIATAPITVLHFSQIAPIGILANLAAIPLVALAVPAIALALAASVVSMPVAHFFAGGADLVLQVLDFVAARAATVPGGHLLLPHDTVAGAAVAVLAGTCVAARLARLAPAPGVDGGGAAPGHGRRAGLGSRGARAIRTPVRRIAATAVAAALLIAWPILARGLHDGALEIHAIDVGQGDAIAIRSPAGRWILVDAGPRDDRYDAGRARVVPFLLRQGARRLEAVVLTHPDIDHIGGAAAVFGAFDVGAMVDPAMPVGKTPYLALLHEAQRRGVRWIAARADREIRIDGVVIRLLHPRDESLDGSPAANEVSVAFRLEYGRFRALFLGDLPAAVEEELAARYGAALRADVVKVAHHGSTTSTSEALLDAASPRLAVVSVGRRNRYGHPDPMVLARLDRYGVRVLRTDRAGTITLRARPDGRVDVRTER